MYGCPVAEDEEREILVFSLDLAVHVLIYFHSLKEKAVREPISTWLAHGKRWINVNYCCYCAGLIWRCVSGN